MFVVLSHVIWGQSADSVALSTAIETFSRREKVQFFFRREWIAGKLVAKNSLNKSINEFLEADVRSKGLYYTKLYEGRYVLLFAGQRPQMINETDSIQTHADQLPVTPANLITISGFVTDAVHSTPVDGATIFIENENTGTVSGVNGHFSLRVPAGAHLMRVSAIGKLISTQRINSAGDVQVNFEMFDETTQLENVTITAESMNSNISSGGMSQVKIDIQTLRSIPPFMGEVDVVKSLLLLPGVSTVGEGASGFNVRGGGVDQNLVLLDETPMFNSSHLFGFVSGFNPDFVREVTLYKGGMPANFGGRVSSVLDVQMRDGNGEKPGLSGGVGIFSSRLLTEGPIGRNGKTTFIAGGRYAYPSWILRKLPDLAVSQSTANFYDVNFRVKHQFNDRNSLHLTTYRSADEFSLAADTTYGWATTNVALKWNTTIRENLIASVSAIYSDYTNDFDGTQRDSEFKTNFGIETRSGKADFTWFATGNHKIDFGASQANYTFNSGQRVPLGDANISPVAMPVENSIEQGFYISDEWKVSDRVLLNLGVRHSRYTNKGAGEVMVYAQGVPRKPSSIVDTLFFDKGESIQTYNGWEPRVSLKISVGENSSVKMSFNRNYQYIHLISNTTAISPLDLWKTSNYHVKPQIGNQFAAGYFVNFFDNALEASLETYYKTTSNMVEYKNGAQLFLNPLLEADLLPAEGRSYGAEVFLRKRTGKLTGWISYTYARSFRRVTGTSEEETINDGNFYPSNFDKPHDLSVVTNFLLTRRISLSGNFTYSTGRPITYPSGVYVLDGYSFAHFPERNQARIPDYHRLDLSLQIEEGLKRHKKWKGSWSFSLYNVYKRRNAYSVFFRPQSVGNQTQSYKLAVVGTIFPSVTYNFKIL